MRLRLRKTGILSWGKGSNPPRPPKGEILWVVGYNFYVIGCQLLVER